MKIDKSDIETLDLIIGKILELDSKIYDGILKDIEKYKDYKISDIKFESNRIMNIIESYGCAKVTRLIRGNTIEKNENTKKFKEHGGFAKIYQDELNRIERENESEKLEINLAKSNLEANELNKSIAAKNDRNEIRNNIGMWVNIFIGVLNIGLIVLQIWLSSQKP